MRTRSQSYKLVILGTGFFLALGMAAWSIWLGVFAVISIFLLYASDQNTRSKPVVCDNAKLTEVYKATTEALAAAIAAKDSYSIHNTTRVQKICDLLARNMGLDDQEIEGIRIAALVRDIGKLGVPDTILLKPGPLDSEEFARMSNHAAVGAELLQSIEYPWDIPGMVLHHHEKYDGSGYPDHLAGDEIPLGSCIISVAEVYDALVSPRCYRDGWSHEQAVDHIEKLSGVHFDPEVVRAFLEIAPQVADKLDSQADDQSRESRQTGFAAAEVISQANREMVSLFEVSQTLSSTLEIDEVVALLAHRARRLTQAATCVVFTIDEAHHETLIARTAAGRFHDVFKGSRARLGKGITGKTVRSKEPRAGHFDMHDLEFTLKGHLALDLKSCAVAPIMSGETLLGAINIYDVSPHAFGADDLRVLSFVAQHAATAIVNASTFEKTRDSAMRDPLTNLHNGRYMNAFLDREISRATRQDQQISFLAIDLDNFKAVNDNLGHQKGDVVLCDVAEILRRHVRDYDVVVRNGGDEFSVILPGAPPQEAARTAERIQIAVDRYASRLKIKGNIKLGVSVGIATFPENAGDPETLVSLADAAMYGDKRARKRDRMAA